ncbi:helix-turn-helix transcriptional regulator [Streptomyces sp. B-S-A8]|uniref:Helix-turn-helix transcriptional regulator n=1 Tax=Streptomyces solicavernae TaxID=3043614 RepID=A0ABT6RL39_9ACTN|nr:helix-turn-helix transcriptional regulator [Streptomyces sp. B-S-A8]MDI3385145.1 helix-turn-helix transcriptional regulator [Streptomyces sp. B-S-A8]
MHEQRPERPAQADGTNHLFATLGKQIKVLREARGMGQRELATATHVSLDLVSAIERNVRIPQPRFLELAEVALDAGGILTAAIPEVKAALARARTRHPEWYRGHAQLESEAVELHHYCSSALHGLLQTAGHAEAVFRHRRPLLDELTIDKRIADRLDRQKLFTRQPAPVISYVLEEALLDRPVGGLSVHETQLRHIMDISSMRNVELQVMPTACEAHPNLGGSFNLLVPKGQHHQVGYTEIQEHPRLISDPAEARVLAERYGIMRAAALTPLKSLELIERKLEKL